MAGGDTVLRTQALRKSFGKLEVTRDVSLALPRGCRHALIGPNGAGKTTLINLITGQLPADSGRIELEGEDITQMPAAARVKRGLTRTFQINTLFPDLTPLEAVTLAVCEREGKAGQFWRALASHGETSRPLHSTSKPLSSKKPGSSARRCLHPFRSMMLSGTVHVGLTRT